jgi:hypothetical protein
LFPDTRGVNNNILKKYKKDKKKYKEFLKYFKSGLDSMLLGHVGESDPTMMGLVVAKSKVIRSCWTARPKIIGPARQQAGLNTLFIYLFNNIYNSKNIK